VIDIRVHHKYMFSTGYMTTHRVPVVVSSQRVLRALCALHLGKLPVIKVAKECIKYSGCCSLGTDTSTWISVLT
jgi:hypothetical protein